MSRSFLRVVLPAVALTAIAFQNAFAGDHCRRCGCCQDVEKVCRVVCEMKDVKTTVYDFECEDFCVACRSKKCGCQKIPVCNKVRTKKKLVKIECVKKVPTYTCVVEYLCPRCCSACSDCALNDGAAVEGGADGVESDPSSAPTPVSLPESFEWDASSSRREKSAGFSPPAVHSPAWNAR